MKFRLILGLLLLATAFMLPSGIPTPVVPIPVPTPTPVIPDPVPIVEEKVEFFDVPIFQNRIKEDSVFASVINRSKNPDLTRGESRSTQAHETSHFIHSELRMKLARANGGSPRAFFIPPDKGFSIREADFKKSAISKYVPGSLQYSRFNVYLRGAPGWEDSPLYIFDEWNAYINGATVAVDDMKAGRPKSDQADTVMGALEFSVYAVATCMAISDNDPALWENAQFKAFTKLNLKRAEAIFTEGKPMFPFAKQDELLASLRTSQDAAVIRDFIIKHFDGIFLSD